MVEIERKFLVKNTDFIAQATEKKQIVQGYLNTDKERTIRVRISGNQAFLTIKGISNTSGTTRFEWEKEISVAEAQSLLPLCEPFPIEKVRYKVPFSGVVFEVDVFENNHKGLIIAEVELQSETQFFEKPNWLAEEVTGKTEFYNSYLSKKPFRKEN